MGTKNIPTIIMLAAGFVTSIVMYVNDYDLDVTLYAILAVFLAFYIFGCLVKRLLDKFCMPPKTEEETEAEGEEAAETEGEQVGEDGSVIEKK